MRIGIVIDSYSERIVNDKIVPQNGGIGVYLIELITGLLDADEVNEYFLIRNRPLSIPFIEHPRLHYVQFPLRNKLHLIARYFGLWRDWAVKNYHLDLVHEVIPCETCFRWASYPLVITVHDVIPLHHPEWFTSKTNRAFRLFIKSNVKKAAAIVSVSQATANELNYYFPGSLDRTRVIPIGYQKISPKSGEEASLINWGITKPYLLIVSTIEPRKNHLALFKAFAEFKKLGYPHLLVCAGTLGWKTENIIKSLSSHPYEKDIILTGLADPELLSSLYRQADIFIYPTLYEGFGIPPLEAMAAGTTVLASDNSSIREVLGDAPFYLSHAPDSKDILRGILKVISSPDERMNKIQLGYLQSSRFSWGKTARETLAVYQDTVRRK